MAGIAVMHWSTFCGRMGLQQFRDQPHRPRWHEGRVQSLFNQNTKQAPHEIGVRSAAKHLQSIEHFKAVERLENAKRKQKRLENERQDESAASGIQDFTFTHEHIHSPIPSGSLSSSLPSAAEVEMWARYEANGANFDAGNNAADVNVHHAQLQKQAEVFSLLDAEGAAKALGFGGNDVMKELLAEDDEEDFLSGITANIDQKCQSGILQLPSSENSFCTSRPTANSEIANCFTLGSIAGQFLEDVICMGDRAFQGSAATTPGDGSRKWYTVKQPRGNVSGMEKFVYSWQASSRLDYRQDR
ncbi:hypothetical protein B0H14DRAFT_2623536 [Mycena olivaceomarginata]|nr:hypothetical protein B0H14DRAFT_2623536 [Mycena olivaceomarginata]